jgi:hypothetical protein
MEYKEYEITVNPFHLSLSKHTKYMFRSLTDCDASIGYGESIADCFLQIDELILNK